MTGQLIAEGIEQPDSDDPVEISDAVRINDEAHVPFSGTNASDVGGYDSDAFLEGVTDRKWISLQHESREFPF